MLTSIMEIGEVWDVENRNVSNFKVYINASMHSTHTSCAAYLTVCSNSTVQPHQNEFSERNYTAV